jgi:hypothetical protein
MSLDLTKLRRVGPQHSDAPSIWTYASGADAITAVDAAGYFNSAADRLQVGDLIYTFPASGAPGITYVNANSRDLTANPPVSGVVDVANHTSLGTIDSD